MCPWNPESLISSVRLSLTSNVVGFPLTKKMCLNETRKITEPQMGLNKFTFFWCNISEHEQSTTCCRRVIKQQPVSSQSSAFEREYFSTFFRVFPSDGLYCAARIAGFNNRCPTPISRNEKLSWWLFSFKLPFSKRKRLIYRSVSLASTPTPTRNER